MSLTCSAPPTRVFGPPSRPALSVKKPRATPGGRPRGNRAVTSGATMLYVNRKRSIHSRVAMLGIAVGLSVVACIKPPARTSSADGATPVHPEAVVIDFYSGGKPTKSCSGTLIAPSVVLTAAHCADGSKAGVVHAPDAN